MALQSGVLNSQIHLSIPPHLHHIGMMGAAVRAVSTQAELDAQSIDEIELAVIEAITNVIRHGQVASADAMLQVDILVYEHLLEYQIKDTGHPIPAHLFERANHFCFSFEQLPLDQLPEGGMGLALIHTIADEMSYHSEAGINTLVIRRYRHRPADQDHRCHDRE